ncbi:hypothetical protein AB0M97_30605 [Streptomyces sp. NPDC051207]|uniref:hypothetical protein n=1 Tax=Streptomyces sp. NPDC051207 TaxID=3154641 RepID=UPI00344791E2
MSRSPTFAQALTGWTRLLPAVYGADSRVPAALAGKLRILITRRAEHPDREECRTLQDQVDAAATAIMTLLAENASPREHCTSRLAVFPFRVDRTRIL